jgi:hypothetical protein
VDQLVDFAGQGDPEHLVPTRRTGPVRIPELEAVAWLFVGQVVSGAHAETVGGGGGAAVGVPDGVVGLDGWPVAAGHHTHRIRGQDQIPQLTAVEALLRIDGQDVVVDRVGDQPAQHHIRPGQQICQHRGRDRAVAAQLGGMVSAPANVEAFTATSTRTGR